MALEIFKKINNEKGISLVELVVAVSVFSMVITAASGIFINALKAQKTIVAKQNVADNLRYIMEFMVKEMRMAQTDTVNPDLTFNDGAATPVTVKNGRFTKISFKNMSSSSIVYDFDSVNSKILRNDFGGTGGAQAISSDEVLITDLKFMVNNWNLTTGPAAAAPFITIWIKAKAKSGAGGETELQTSVSPRIY
ncbi:MAG: prepilin-type N-terminal cleavage/methylation domain-containing protein [bacterium]|nr:prepilin-type N-terminal cleavage/methylation domain-containing protein [bacterium]